MTDFQEQLRTLIGIQDIELEIVQSEKKIASFDDEAASLEKAISTFEASNKAAKEAAEALKKNYRKLEAESKSNADFIAKSNGKLHSVKTNKEYQSILKEIEELGKKNSGIEDEMIALLDKIEIQEADVKKKEAELTNFVQSCNQKKTVLDDDIVQKKKQIERLNEKKAQLTAVVSPNTLKILGDVKSKVRGMAVVPVEQSVCMGCHLNIPAQLFNELLRFDELRFCPHCNRIIYWKEKENEERPE